MTHRTLTATSRILLSSAFGLALAVAPVSLAPSADSGVSFTAQTAAAAGAQNKGAGQGQGKGRSGSTGGQMRGKGGKSMSDILRSLTGEDDGDDSDRPEWAGQPGGKDDAGGGRPPTSGSKKGDLFGDLWIILRDDQGVPILTAEGWVQPLDADGNVIPLDEEGHPVDETLTQEVELGRLNVGRAPSKVLDRRADEVIALLNDATALSLDPAGRLVITTVDADGIEVSKTIDSPLENLAIYVALMTDGSIPGVEDLPGTDFDFMVDGSYSAEDLAASAAFLAAATDKTGAFTSDEIAYINVFLDVNTVTTGSVTYSNIDYSSIDYDRETTYGDVVATVLVEQPDGTFVPTTVNVFDAVFGSVDASALGSLEAYTLAADDSRTVVNFIHEFEVPDLNVATH